MARFEISAAASGYLEKWLDQLFLGELELWQVPLALQDWYQAGFNEGIAVQPDHARLAWIETEADRLYLAAFSPKDRREVILDRIDKGYKLIEAAQWKAAETDLLACRLKNETSGTVETPSRASTNTHSHAA
jgi:hypothetical protein